jgi:glycerophosphoryl diester phosphodiesterase
MIVHEIAHRGWAMNAPENTRAAFESVFDGKFSGLADGMECDVQMSKDGHVVVMHDIALGRISYGNGSVGDFTYDELKCFDCGSWFSPRFAGESVMLFSTLLKLVDGKNFLCIELKNPGNMEVGLTC